jgi:hypothetical protein
MSASGPGAAESIEQSEKEQATKRLIIIHLLLVALNLLILAKIIPVYATIYAGFGAKLPAVTQFVIQLSSLARHWFILATIPACGTLLLLDTLVHRLILNSMGKGAARAWLIGVGVVLLLFGVGLVVACNVPIFQMHP